MRSSDSDARARRAELLRIASRTFAVGIERLPGTLLEPIRTAYLLLRVSDYLEDSENLEVARKIALLDHWAAVLDQEARVEAFLADLGEVDEQTPDAVVAAETRIVLQGLASLAPPARRIVTHHVTETTRGMARWTRRGPDFADEADLDDYMHEVAGRVGWLLTDLFVETYPSLRASEPRLRDLGRSFGLGLQTVNVIRGLHQDHTRGWVYIPRSYLAEAGLQGPELFEADSRGAALSVLTLLTDKADRHLADALEYITFLPRRAHGARIFCALPLFFAIRTLALSRDNPDVFDQEVKMGRAEVGRIVRTAGLRAWSNRWLRDFTERLRAEPG